MNDELILWAILSVICRASLNVIDRYQFGFQSKSIKFISLINNLLPLIFILPGFLFFGRLDLIQSVLDFKIAVYAILIQINAYAFSFCLRYAKVSTIGLAAKSADIVIPLGLYVFYNVFSLNALLFALLSTIICFFAFYEFGGKKMNSSELYIVYIPISIMVLALFTPALIGKALLSVQESISVAFAIIVWRTFFSLLIFIKNADWASFNFSKIGRLTLARGGITILTQYSFVMATASPKAAIAWPILNGTLFISTIMSFLFLKEVARFREWVGVLLFVFLGVLQFVLN